MIKNTRLETSVYCLLYLYLFIRTDRHAYLNLSCFHPRQTKESVLYSPLLRYRGIYSRDHLFTRKATELLRFFLNRGYPYPLFNYRVKRIFSLKRLNLLAYREKADPIVCPLWSLKRFSCVRSKRHGSLYLLTPHYPAFSMDHR